MSQEELVKIESNPLANVPDFLKTAEGNAGLENVRPEDLILPRLMLCQALTPQKKRSSENYIAGLEDGDLFNSVTGRNYGKSVQVIPLVYTRSRIFFNPLEEGGGINCQSQNGINGGRLAPVCDSCEHSKFANDESPDCQLFMNFASLLLIDGETELIAVSFKSSGLKSARNWVQRMMALKRPSYSSVYEVKAFEKKGQKGEYFVPTVTRKDWVRDEKLYAFAEAQYEAIKGKTITTDEETAPEARSHASDEDIPF